MGSGRATWSQDGPSLEQLANPATPLTHSGVDYEKGPRSQLGSHRAVVSVVTDLDARLGHVVLRQQGI